MTGSVPRLLAHLTRPLAIVATALLCSIGLAAIPAGDPPEAEAASGWDFDAGYIISDSNFYDSNSMDANSVQAFLNAHVPTCHPEWDNNPTDITCLKDYWTQTTWKSADAYCSGYDSAWQSAAQIIDGVARSCGISQKVLLVTLQKENALVDHAFPSSWRYRTAMGYGCPDGAACDAQYFGLFNQIYNAARQFKVYAAHPSWYRYRAGQNNYIQWNPDAACGGSTVYIRNQATASLYNYTPYQPNNAAKAAGYGLGDGCSSYGNRNFFLYYSDWFGIPRGYVDTVKLTANGAVHIAGWTFDPLDSSASIDAHVYITNIDKQKTSLIGLKANHSRNDVNSAYSISGLHGFDGDVSLTSGGGHYQICVYGVTGSRHIDLGCTVVDATAASPRGVLDSATATADGQQGGITVRGWAYDPGTPETSIPVHVYVTDPNGRTTITGITADQDRTDVNAFFSINGSHGYQTTIPATTPGKYTVCTYAIGTDWRNKNNNPRLGCTVIPLAP
jgi:hypothetical protein